jgi:hypothetical protein
MQNDQTKRQIHIADDFAATVHFFFRFGEKRNTKFLLCALCALCGSALSLR